MQLLQQASLSPAAPQSRARFLTARISTAARRQAAVMFQLYLALASTWLSFHDFFTCTKYLDF